MDPRAPVPDLLVALHAVVLEGGAPPGFAGTIGVGVREGGAARWWTASFEGASSKKVVARLDVPVDASERGARPAGCDAWLVVGQRGAAALLAGTPVRPNDLDVGGDVGLLDRFLARYRAPVRGWQTRLTRGGA